MKPARRSSPGEGRTYANFRSRAVRGRRCRLAPDTSRPTHASRVVCERSLSRFAHVAGPGSSRVPLVDTLRGRAVCAVRGLAVDVHARMTPRV